MSVSVSWNAAFTPWALYVVHVLKAAVCVCVCGLNQMQLMRG